MSKEAAFYYFMDPCVFCGELITYADPREDYGDARRAHRNCGLRAVIGSVAHLERRCSCFVPGSQENDPPGMSKRQAADAAVELWMAMQKKECN